MPPRPVPRSWLARRLRDAADAAERWADRSGPADADPPVDVPPRRPGQPPEHWLRLVAEHAPGLLRDLDLPPDAAGWPAGPAPSEVRGQPTAPGHAPAPHPAPGRATAAVHRPGAGLTDTTASRPHGHRPGRSDDTSSALRADPADLSTMAGDQALRRVVASGHTGDSGNPEDRAAEGWPGPWAGLWESASSTGSGGVGSAPAGFPVRLRPAVPPPGWLSPVAGSAPDRPPVAGSTPDRPPVAGSTPDRLPPPEYVEGLARPVAGSAVDRVLPVSRSAADRGVRPGTGPGAGAASHGLPLPPAHPGPGDAGAPGLPGGPHGAAAAHPRGSRAAGPGDAPAAGHRGSPAPHGSTDEADRSGGVRFAAPPATNHPDGAGTGRPGFSPATPAGTGLSPATLAGTGYASVTLTGTGYGPAPGHVPDRFTGAEFPFPPSVPGRSPASGDGRAAGDEAHRAYAPGGGALLPRAVGPDGVPPHLDGLRVGAARAAWWPGLDPLAAGTVNGHPDDPPPTGRPGTAHPQPGGHHGAARPPHGGHHAGDDPDGWRTPTGDPWPALPDEPPGPGRDAVVVSPGGTTTTARWWRDDPWPALPDDRDRRPAVDADAARWRRLDSEQRGA
ncbi:hypothetical protein AB0K04_11520 [Micromonospora coxensis]|uniref:hypothetical protein n=1 Tax=Micromonospora coxensis TaxID=356852 RepID=UPI003442F941